MGNFWSVLRQTLKNMLGKPLWLLTVLSVALTTLPYAHRTMDDLPVAVIDMDHSAASRELIRLLDAAPKIAVRSYSELPTAQHDLAWRRLFGIVILPVDFEKRVLRGEAVSVPIFGDATNRMAEACGEVFMMVGQGWAFDGSAEQTRVGCGLPSVPGYTVSSVAAHGPKTFVNARTLVVVFVSNDPLTRRYDLDLVDELRRDGCAGRIIEVTAQPRTEAGTGSIAVPDMTTAADLDLLWPYIAIAQTYAFFTSRAMGVTPDNPNPAGIVNRVVQGVRLHALSA